MPVNVAVTWKVVWSILGFLVSVMGATAYVTWEVRKDYIEDLKNQVSVYNQAESWKLPDTLRKLNDVSEKLQAQFSNEAKIEKLTLEKTAAETSVKKLESQLASSTSQNKVLTATVTDLQRDIRRSLTPATQFTLKEGESFELAKNQSVFGLSSLFSNSIIGKLNGERVSLELAGTLSIDVGGEQCALRLIQTRFPTATLSFACATAGEQKKTGSL